MHPKYLSEVPQNGESEEARPFPCHCGAGLDSWAVCAFAGWFPRIRTVLCVNLEVGSGMFVWALRWQLGGYGRRVVMAHGRVLNGCLRDSASFLRVCPRESGGWGWGGGVSTRMRGCFGCSLHAPKQRGNFSSQLPFKTLA